jgi:hypothetical protein
MTDAPAATTSPIAAITSTAVTIWKPTKASDDTAFASVRSRCHSVSS